MPRKQTYEEIQEMFNKEGYTLVTSKESYKNSTTKVDIICDNKHTHSMYPKDFKNGVRCAKCRGLARHTYEDVKRIIESKGYTLISKEYINNRGKLHLICPYGHTLHASLDTFVQGRRCRRCRSSKGENVIRFVLSQTLPKDIKIVEQKKVMFNGVFYFFDFFIDIDEGLYIEYDGEQHFRPIDFWGGTEGFKEQKYRDTQKNNYVKRKGGKLLRIPYTKSYVDIYQDIMDFLDGKVSLSSISTEELSKAEYYGKHEFSMNDVVSFYYNHSMKETVSKFNLNEATIHRYFRSVYGTSKRELKKKELQKEMAEYYLTHTNKETQRKYGVSDVTLQKYFKEVYGTDKTSFLKVNNV